MSRAVGENRGSLRAPGAQYGFWHAASEALEDCRALLCGRGPRAGAADAAELFRDFLRLGGVSLAHRLELSRRPDGLMPTYFSYEAEDWRVTEEGIEPLSFRQNSLPLFLEVPVHDIGRLQKDARLRHKSCTRRSGKSAL
ncbi:MAG: hypothetical protein ACLTSG_00775 [Lachnospiraceae bacterium]